MYNITKPQCLGAMLLGLLMSVFNLDAANADTVKVAVAPIENLLTPPGKTPGAYNKVLSQIADLDIYFVPQARVDKMFYDKQVDCMFPASTVNMTNVTNFIQSQPINRTHVFVFSKQPYTSFHDFTGLSLGVKRGLSLGNIRQRLSATYVELENSEALVAMLKKDRLDAIVAYEIDALAIYEKLGESVDFYLKSNPVHSIDEAFVCHKTPALDSFITETNRKIAQFNKPEKPFDGLPVK